jgi:hypothetical protein
MTTKKAIQVLTDLLRDIDRHGPISRLAVTSEEKKAIAHLINQVRQ